MILFSTHKEEKTYYNTGEVETIFQTLNNQKDGPLKIFHKNGQLKVIVNYKNGVQIDEIVNSFDENGKLIRTVEIKKSELNGAFKEFYSNGNLKCEGIYKDNEIIDKKVYDENEKLKYHYLKSSNKVKVKTLTDFKIELKKIIEINYFNDLEIEIGIPKWSVFRTMDVKGVYRKYKFNGLIHDICKWHDFESYYESINDFYDDIKKINSNDLNIDFIYELTKNGRCSIDFPTEDFDYSDLIWQDDTPEEIKEEFQPGFDLNNFCEIIEWGSPFVPVVSYFKIILRNCEDNIDFIIKWENENSERIISTINMLK